MLAAMKWQRNSIGVEIDSHYCDAAANRLRIENTDLSSSATVNVFDPVLETKRIAVVNETRVPYRTKRKSRPAKVKLSKLETPKTQPKR
jgi:hypothetical protein